MQGRGGSVGSAVGGGGASSSSACTSELARQSSDAAAFSWPPLQVPVLYPFGHGLSYTSFAYQQMSAAYPASGGSSDCSAAAAPLLQLSVRIANTGGVAADEVALLLLSFAGNGGQQLRQRQQRWRWPLQRDASTDPAAAHAVPILLDLPCTASSDGGGQPEGLPVQTLVGFERLHLAPGESAPVSFNLTASHFVPFSPLAEGSRGGGGDVDDDVAGGCRQAARPYCGHYLLRAGGQQQLVVRLGSSTGVGGATAQQ